ncbi:SCP-like protein [Teladorsagia circumcincta]|uniref:SCP-like protein n=1 Tax=Teladorsagia circumcincta TaxID=45464 RepID=A0A2G9UI38_TELCI|nr:SCP-like protein [Teladorsagia circumcincta]
MPNFIESSPAEDLGELECGGEMTAEHRAVFIQDHNKYRSLVAKGKYTIDAPSSELRVLPRASRMIQLKYNCSLEKSALEWAQQAQCGRVHSKDLHVGENMYRVSSYGSYLDKSFSEVAKQATEKWSTEIKKNGASSIDEWNKSIGHATQVFWADTTTIGCAITRCDDQSMSAICHYYPQGNYRGKQWYKPGETLSECGKYGESEVAHLDTGLCELQ